MNLIKDSTFRNIKNYTLSSSSPHGGYWLSKDWIVKTAIGRVVATVTKVKDGLNIHANYGAGIDYIYIRQIIKNIEQFSNKDIEIKVKLKNNSKEDVKYDLYIQARVDNDNTHRLLVIDSATETLDKNELTFRTKVPYIDSKTVKEGNGLSVAFRLIGMDYKSYDVTIQSIELRCLNCKKKKCNIWCKIKEFFNGIF